jgi:hypothetical protein
MIDEDTAHDVRGDSNKMLAALPIDIIVRKAKIGFVNESRRLKRMLRSLSPHIRLSHAVKLLIDERQQLFGGRLVSVLHGLQ